MTSMKFLSIFFTTTIYAQSIYGTYRVQDPTPIYVSHVFTFGNNGIVTHTATSMAKEADHQSIGKYSDFINKMYLSIDDVEGVFDILKINADLFLLLNHNKTIYTFGRINTRSDVWLNHYNCVKNHDFSNWIFYSEMK